VAGGAEQPLEQGGIQMSRPGSDEELKEAMRVISKINDVPLSAHRIEVALPAYRRFLEQIGRFDGVDMEPDEAPAFVFQLRPHGGRE
jgi:hypothetical protein